MGKLIHYTEALEKILNTSKNLTVETIDIIKANQRILAESISSPLDLPGYDNSAMDGYALYAEITKEASSTNPVWLKVDNCIGAGEKTTSQPSREEAIAIMTGAPLPQGVDTVIPIENVLTNPEKPDSIGITTPLMPGDNIRKRGEDIKTHTLLLDIGQSLNPARIMTLSGVGVRQVRVFKTLKTLIIATGKELVLGQPQDTSCQVPDCNSPFLYTSLQHEWNMEIETAHVLSDTEEELIELLEKAFDNTHPPEIIISTGAVSAGRYDFIPNALKRMNANIVFHAVAIRPGKPILFAIFPNGTYYFGLPGNPAAVAAGLRFFVYPLLRQWYQMPQEQPKYAKLDKKVSVNKALTFFQRAHYYTDITGQARVEIAAGQASFMISTMANTNAWAVVADGPVTLEKDALVPVYSY